MRSMRPRARGSNTSNTRQPLPIQLNLNTDLIRLAQRRRGQQPADFSELGLMVGSLARQEIGFRIPQAEGYNLADLWISHQADAAEPRLCCCDRRDRLLKDA